MKRIFSPAIFFVFLICFANLSLVLNMKSMCISDAATNCTGMQFELVETEAEKSSENSNSEIEVESAEFVLSNSQTKITNSVLSNNLFFQLHSFSSTFLDDVFIPPQLYII